MAQGNGEKNVPIYYQLYSDLRERILNGEYPPGKCVPSESEMMARYGVSRITVRRAIADLEGDGLLKRVRGKGSVVLERKSVHNLNSLYSLSEMAKRRGDQVSYIILDKAVRSAEIKTARELGIPNGSMVFELKRLLLINGKVAALTTAYVPYEEGWKDLLENFDENTSLFERLQAHKAIIDYAEETLEFVIPSSEVRKALCLPYNIQAVLSVHRTYDPDGKMLIYTETYIASNKFKYVITIHRNQ